MQHRPGGRVANYSLSPYAISAAPRYERAGERRPINDIDGTGVSFRQVILGVLRSVQGAALSINSDDASRGLRVAELVENDRFIYVELGVGRAGIEGTLHRRSGQSVDYGPDEHNESLVRSMFVFPRDGHEVYWLNERAGMASARSDLGQRLMRAFRDVAPDMTFKVRPVVAWAAVMQWAQQVPVREINFDAPRDGDSQAMLANGYGGNVRISVKPHADMRLSRLVRGDGADRQAVFGFLRDIPVVEDGLTVDGLVGAGWSATVAFETPSGHQRSFGVGVGDEPPSLIYQVGPDQTNLRVPIRPTPAEFADACCEFLQDGRDLAQHLASVVDDILQTFGG